MRRFLMVCALLGLGGAGWWYVAYDPLSDVDVPPVVPADPPSQPPVAPRPPTRRELLHEARRLCQLAPLDTFVQAQQQLVGEAPDDDARGDQLQVLAEALLERVYMRTSRLAMRPGEPQYSRVPREIERDIQAGLKALAQARALGVTEADGYRIEGSLLANRISGTFSAMNLKRDIINAYTQSLDLDGDNPRLHVALGCRKLFAPKMLGRDLDKALEHLEYACSRLPQDERPRLFAALAAYLKDDEAGALAWAEEALKVNNRSIFAIALVERLRAGEDNPVGRDV